MSGERGGTTQAKTLSLQTLELLRAIISLSVSLLLLIGIIIAAAQHPDFVAEANKLSLVIHLGKVVTEGKTEHGFLPLVCIVRHGMDAGLARDGSSSSLLDQTPLPDFCDNFNVIIFASVVSSRRWYQYNIDSMTTGGYSILVFIQCCHTNAIRYIAHHSAGITDPQHTWSLLHLHHAVLYVSVTIAKRHIINRRKEKSSKAIQTAVEQQKTMTVERLEVFTMQFCWPTLMQSILDLG
ncbi:hypothetical protein T4C_841 [Trichinella pseudospiralis]|nr:hypothetical protein T4C_841 [Trichinella pseudospiralis]